jgi:hypothetical protein
MIGFSMKKQIVFISGGDAFSNREDFLRSLKVKPIRNLPGNETSVRWTKTLETDLGDFEVFMPSMPNTNNASFDEWKIWFERHFEFLHEGATLIGWSLGGMFLAKYLSENEVPFTISALHLLAAPCGTYDDDEGNDCGTFQFDPEILNNLSEKLYKISIWHSKDDFVVPYEAALEYKKRLPIADLHTFEDKNHFLVEKFPEFLDVLNK